jgi:hypothetical protein
MCWIIQSMTLLEEGAGGQEFPEEEAGRSMRKVTQQSQRDIVLRLADLLDPLGQRQRQPQLGANHVKHVLAPKQRTERVGSVELLDQDARSGVGLRDRRLRVPFRCLQCLSECKQQIELLLPVPRAVRQAGQQVQALLQLRHRLRHRRARDRVMARFELVADRLIGHACFGAMLCHKFGVSRYYLWKPALQRGGNTAMQLLPTATQQGAVRSILHQCVLESVLGIGRRAAPEH